MNESIIHTHTHTHTHTLTYIYMYIYVVWLKLTEMTTNYFYLYFAALNDQWGTPRDSWVQLGGKDTKRTKCKIHLSY